MTPAALHPDDRRHGTANGYGNCKCRCARCREAWRVYCHESGRMAAHRSKIRSLPTPDRMHGTHTGYTNYGCRCEMCRGVYRGQYQRLKWKREASRCSK